MRAIWLSKPETARRVRQRIKVVLDWAKASGFRAGTIPSTLVFRLISTVLYDFFFRARPDSSTLNPASAESPTRCASKVSGGRSAAARSSGVKRKVGGRVVAAGIR